MFKNVTISFLLMFSFNVASEEFYELPNEVWSCWGDTPTFSISPNGKYLAIMRSPREDVCDIEQDKIKGVEDEMTYQSLTFIDLETMQSRVFSDGVGEKSIYGFQWVSDDRFIYRPGLTNAKGRNMNSLVTFAVNVDGSKRKIIGKTFIEVFDKAAKKITNVDYLGQGTLYPDIIESIPFFGGPTAKIKSHHNVGGLPKKMKLKIVEPLRELFKDEVRNVGRQLKIDKHLLLRHPFPGPGLAIRIPGVIDKKKILILQEADHIFIEYLKEKNLYNKIWQAFVVLLPVKSVGVMGDERTYNYSVSFRAITSVDGMTADFFNFKKELFSQLNKLKKGIE